MTAEHLRQPAYDRPTGRSLTPQGPAQIYDNTEEEQPLAVNPKTDLGFDEPALAALIEESRDIHSDSLRTLDESLSDFVDAGHQARASGLDPDEHDAFRDRRIEHVNGALAGKLVAAAGLGSAMVAMLAAPASASSSTDVEILQTAASIEAVAVATYQTALTLPFIGGSSANPLVKSFVETTTQQHQQHQQAFNAAITKLGGKQQNSPDPVLLQLVNKAKPSLTSPGPVVALALELEEGAAETYVANVSSLSDANAKATTASIMGVEAQHAAILRAVQALLNANAAQLIALPPSPLTSLPAAAGSVGFPAAFYPTNNARPNQEGAVS